MVDIYNNLMENIYINQDKKQDRDIRMSDMIDKFKEYLIKEKIIISLILSDFITDKVLTFFASKGELKDKNFNENHIF